MLNVRAVLIILFVLHLAKFEILIMWHIGAIDDTCG